MENKVKDTSKLKKVALGLSGGVDSSVCAALLADQGFDVTGVFLECWDPTRPGCRVDQDRKDALNIALKLNIPFQVLDFKKAYNDRVLEYFYNEYQAGRTPNPDTLCNREIKFGLFYDWAIAQGFDCVATGHYARIFDAKETKNEKQETNKGLNLLTNQLINQSTAFLQRGLDSKKDQSYFLYQLRPEQLHHILFPIGHLEKSQVRQIAKDRELLTASKPDSQGICFIGNVDVADFLKERIKEKLGDVVIKINEQNEVLKIGTHKGVYFHTIGQKIGKEIDQALVAKLSKKGLLSFDPTNLPPLFVIEKEIEKNILIVGTEDQTYQDEFEVGNINWLISEFVNWNQDKNLKPVNQLTNQPINFYIRIRHGGELVRVVSIKKRVVSEDLNKYNLQLILEKAVRGVAPGQACVIYSDNSSDAILLGGGVIL